MLLAEDEDEDDEDLLASDSSPSFAKFVEPPELPTLLIHKVFGERCAFFFVLVRLLLEFVMLSLSSRRTMY